MNNLIAVIRILIEENEKPRQDIELKERVNEELSRIDTNRRKALHYLNKAYMKLKGKPDLKGEQS